ncbi:peptidyl-tRNA hydrolase isoform X1 [Alligator mississippiensis]|nr:peptidyl-tRNA hydrolase isoform X1 [Alligator mississippiensis]
MWSRAMSQSCAVLRAAASRVLVAGLGNHGLQGTRHNVGMAVLAQLAQKLNVTDQWRADRRCRADVAVASLEELDVVLLKPWGLMNVNGLSIANAAETYKVGIEDIYLVHDDVDKPLGKIAMKLGGSARGHNGVRSCIGALHSDRMVRLRVGIGRPVGEAMVDRFVLGRFTTAEQEVLPRVLEQAVSLLLEHILRGSRGTKAALAPDRGQGSATSSDKGDQG